MAPRIDRNRSLPQPYRPAPPPAPGAKLEEVVRATWDELSRIATSFSDLDRPLSLGVHGPDTLTVGAAASYQVMLNASPVIDWQQPGGAFNPSTGVWTCPTEGLYFVAGSLVSVPMSAPALKSYTVLGQLTLARVVGGSTVYAFTGGGLDDQYVAASGSVLIPMQQGDTLQMSGAAVHPTKGGTNAVTAYLSVSRQSGTGNAD